MRQSDALSRPVLFPGAAEKIENPLMVLGIDAAAIVGYFEDRKTELCPAPNSDVAGNARLEVF